MISNKVNKNKACIWATVCLGALIYISLIFNENIWMDEAFSAVLVKGTLFEVISRSAADTLPPLYNLLNWLMISIFGYHTWVLRLMSVLPMIGCLILSAIFIDRRFGTYAALLFNLCICGMPQLLYYGVEIRMYALGLFFVTAAGIFAVDIFYMTDFKHYIPFLICTLGAGYTHHFAFAAAGMLYLLLLINGICISIKEHRVSKQLKLWLINLMLTALLYLPCLLVTLKQMKRVSGYFTMPEVTAGFILACFKLPFITQNTLLSALLMALFALAVCVGLVYIIYNKFKDSGFFLIGLAFISIYFMVMLFGLIATTLFKSNIFTDRYLVPSLGLLWLGFAILISGFQQSFPSLSKAVKACLFTLLPLVLAVAVLFWDYHIAYAEEYRPGVKDMLSYFNENIRPDDEYVIFEDNYQIEICFRYYFPNFKKCEPDRLYDAKGRLYYLEVSGYENKKEEIIQLGYSLSPIGDFSFDRYSFTMYELIPSP